MRKGVDVGHLLRALKKPWLLHDTDKCLLLSLVVLPATLIFDLCEYLYLKYPDLAPYIDQDFLAVLLPLHLILPAGWIAILVASVVKREDDRWGRLLVYLFVQHYFIGFSLTSYVYGHYTTDYMGSVLLGGTVVSFLVFDRRPVLLGLASMLLIVGGTTIAEQAGLIPYGPLLATSPAEGHRLASSWLWSLGSLIILAQVLSALIAYYFFNRLRDSENELDRASQLIRQYVPAQVAEEIMSGRYAVVDQHARRKITVFFSDLVGFTEIAERLEPEQLSQVLNQYFTEMTAIAQRHGGTVDELSGDAILVFFGAPHATTDKDHALRAIRMADEMQDKVGALNARWLASGVPVALKVRMGINSGIVTIGNFGSPGRMKYAAIGTHVNLAARLQAHCQPGQILLSHDTWLLVNDQVQCSQLGELNLKGIQQPVMAYEFARIISAPQ